MERRGAQTSSEPDSSNGREKCVRSPNDNEPPTEPKWLLSTESGFYYNAPIDRITANDPNCKSVSCSSQSSIQTQDPSFWESGPNTNLSTTAVYLKHVVEGLRGHDPKEIERCLSTAFQRNTSISNASFMLESAANLSIRRNLLR